jgi:ribosomal protein L11 methyltransferase
VLALAAVRLGARSAVGVDIEPAAVAATTANAARNGLADQVCAVSTPLAELTGSFDVVLANIGLDVLVELAPDVERLLAPGAWIGLSGISPTQEWRLAAGFPFANVIATPRLDDWSAVILVHSAKEESHDHPPR